MKIKRDHPFVTLCVGISLFLAAGSQSAKSDDANPAEKSAGSATASVPVQTKDSQAAMTPAAALAQLREGNARFAAGTSSTTNAFGRPDKLPPDDSASRV